ncbi:MAG: poly-gamma-glutamate system protein [Candidatus Neomarinimicrobiota bacterium]
MSHRLPRGNDLRWIPVLLTAVVAVVATNKFLIDFAPRADSTEMHAAANLTEYWYRIVAEEKAARSIPVFPDNDILFPGLLGEDFSPITTTLGSLAAKELSIQPEFSALIVRLVHEAGLSAGDRVGVILSGSFPALGIATLAALQVLEMEPLVFSSLGASSFGANQPDATWIDLENWLIERGGLKFRSLLVSYGAEDDNGGGMFPGGPEQLQAAFERNRCPVYQPADLEQSIVYKTELLQKAGIKLLINIGGNQAGVGNCSHVLEIPPGLNYQLPACGHAQRGVVFRLNQNGIPVLHLLNIRELSIRYGIKRLTGYDHHENYILYGQKEVRPAAIIGLLLILSFLVFLIRKPGGSL